MKVLKIALVTLFATFTMVAFAQVQVPDRDHAEFGTAMIKITQIDKNSDFGESIARQVDFKSLVSSGEQAKYYVAEVRLNGKRVKVYGTYWQWFRFLRLNYNPWPSVGEGGDL